MTKKNRVVLIALLLALSVASSLPFNASGQAAQQAVTAQRPIELADSLAWKRVASPTISNDGQWFAHKVTPNEGDSELVLRRISDGKEWRFPVGESQGFGGFPGAGARDVEFSDDSKWLVFTISPTFKDGKRLKKERKPSQNKVAIINLATEKKVEIEKVKRFSFLAKTPPGSRCTNMVRKLARQRRLLRLQVVPRLRQPLPLKERPALI